MKPLVEVSVGDYTVSADRAKLDVAVIHRFLTRSYWAEGVTLEVVARSLEHSLPFGVYRGAEQVGLARVVTDYATFMYLSDVFIVEAHRGQGLGVALLAAVMTRPELAELRTSLLLTADAHSLYERSGFRVVEDGRAIRRRAGT